MGQTVADWLGPDWLSLLVLGGRGHGKSVLVRDLVRSCPRLVILNTAAESAYRGLGLVVRDPHEAIDCLVRWRSRARFRLVAELGSMAEFDGVWRVAAQLRDCVVVVEEVWSYCGPQHGRCWHSQALALARHLGNRTVAVAQRPAQVHKVFFADRVLVGRIAEGNDTSYLRSCGLWSPELLKRLPDLKPFDGSSAEWLSFPGGIASLSASL